MLGQAEFAERFFGRAADDPVVGKLRDAARAVASASSHAELRGAAEKIGEAMQIVGLDRWPRVMADAEARARDPETVAAIENSRQPPDVSKDAIRPVYPVETLLGIAAIGLESGAVAGLRASGGAILKPFLPESSLPIGDGATKRVGENAELENSASTKQIDEKAKLETAGSPVQLDKGQQGKHIAGSNNYDPTRSTLTADPRELLKRFAGRGEKRGHTPVGQPGSREAFDTGTEVIGINRSRSGISAPTTRGVIHYSKRGAHVVPATPRK